MKRVYADYNATGPVDPAHYDEVVKMLKEVDGNPSSIHHFGRTAKIALEDARAQIAKLLSVGNQQIVFTSGATESNNFAIQGVVCKNSQMDEIPHIIITSTEHPSVRTTAEILRDRGLCELTIAPVDNYGIVNEEELLQLIKPSTVLICMIHANNEVGSINPVKEISEKIKNKKDSIHIHIDSVQAFGKIDMTWLENSKIDSLSASSHKISGFKGVGLLYLKKNTTLNTYICGGGQERNRRSGTENMPGIISFGLRAKHIRENPDWFDGVNELKAKLVEEFLKIDGLEFHGDLEKGLPSTFNFHIEGVPGEDIMLNFDLAGICISSGSACSSGVQRPSAVLKAMGYPDWIALNSTRISFGPHNTLEDVDIIIHTLKKVIARAKKYS